jgi:hypothetical protein
MEDEGKVFVICRRFYAHGETVVPICYGSLTKLFRMYHREEKDNYYYVLWSVKMYEDFCSTGNRNFS